MQHILALIYTILCSDNPVPMNFIFMLSYILYRYIISTNILFYIVWSSMSINNYALYGIMLYITYSCILRIKNSCYYVLYYSISGGLNGFRLILTLVERRRFFLL
jgi:hypothetical protein